MPCESQWPTIDRPSGAASGIKKSQSFPPLPAQSSLRPDCRRGCIRTAPTEAPPPARNSFPARAPTASSRASGNPQRIPSAEKARRKTRQISRCARRAKPARRTQTRPRRATPASERSVTRFPTASPPRSFAQRRAEQASRSRRRAGFQCGPSRSQARSRPASCWLRSSCATRGRLHATGATIPTSLPIEK